MLLFETEAFKSVAENAWTELEGLNDHVTLDVYVMTPNHFHGIIWLNEPCRGGSRTAPTARSGKPLGRLIGTFKTMSTKRINAIRGTPAAVVWQRSYNDRIIRDEPELLRAREYILDNPRRWAEDKENPALYG